MAAVLAGGLMPWPKRFFPKSYACLSQRISRPTANVRAIAPHVCLLDIGLPGMDGHEFARRLRAQPETPRSVLIALRGYSQEKI